MIASWPGTVPAGVASQDLIDSVDIYPTLAALAGIRLPGQPLVDGVSFADRLWGRGRRSPRLDLHALRTEAGMGQGQVRATHVRPRSEIQAVRQRRALRRRSRRPGANPFTCPNAPRSNGGSPRGFGPSWKGLRAGRNDRGEPIWLRLRPRSSSTGDSVAAPGAGSGK